ncbi:MEKHLA domain protein [Thalassoglobus neptunius]|uniref:MEKHLA domain protein n=1 Tax=Thalassoglobus neptunius TaxID=1938619 RepID=A0A5C5X6G4_9PLAN|nr:MEKHLA domain-containing protein [Thalassoglobus neptunius]TWT58239.1 MEKHLA domain protein [Thalassoglobus neptunius]
MSQDSLWIKRNWVAHTQLMLDSYERYLKKELIPREGSQLDQAKTLFLSPFVVVSHDYRPDPVLNYGNQVALDLWEMDVATLCNTPSRMTAEPMHRDERKRLLKRTTENGYVDDYSGIRISQNGRRFLIRQAVVWNLIDFKNNYRGQAATFSEWEWLDENESTPKPSD